MENENRKPDFKIDGCAVWKNIDKNGNDFLTIKLLGHNTFNVFKYIDKPKGDKE
jgi:hypothetical protein